MFYPLPSVKREPSSTFRCGLVQCADLPVRHCCYLCESVRKGRVGGKTSGRVGELISVSQPPSLPSSHRCCCCWKQAAFLPLAPVSLSCRVLNCRRRCRQSRHACRVAVVVIERSRRSLLITIVAVVVIICCGVGPQAAPAACSRDAPLLRL